MSCASNGFALPANTEMVGDSNSLLRDINSFHRARIGWGGRIRTSVWRDQNPLPYRLATPQLEKSPPASNQAAPVSNQAAPASKKRRRSSSSRQPLKQGRVVEGASQECIECRRQPAQNVTPLERRTRQEHAGPRAGQACCPESRQPIERTSHFGIS